MVSVCNKELHPFNLTFATLQRLMLNIHLTIKILSGQKKLNMPCSELFILDLPAMVQNLHAKNCML